MPKAQNSDRTICMRTGRARCRLRMLIFATYHNAGLRIFDIRDPFQPRQVGYFVPPPPERIVDQRPNPAKVIQSCDVFVDPDGIMYLTDTNAGLYILQYEGR